MRTHVALRYHLQRRLAAAVPTRPTLTVPPRAGIFLHFTKRDQLPTRAGRQVADDADKGALSQTGTVRKTLRMIYPYIKHAGFSIYKNANLLFNKCIQWANSSAFQNCQSSSPRQLRDCWRGPAVRARSGEFPLWETQSHSRKATPLAEMSGLPSAVQLTRHGHLQQHHRSTLMSLYHYPSGCAP